MPTGYSGTPLAQKLGLAPGQRAWFRDMPETVRAEIAPDALGVHEQAAPSAGLDLAHIFVTERAALACEVAALRELLAPTGALWVSWPKRASGAASDITEDVVREVALPLGLVDVKVCAIDETWSALKLMIRRELR
jgi:hypothetical protein